ncbi:GNAT family N-acetyltransferase [Thalassospira mesophila]|uniref:GNAT family N-acetyltransferase n=1 Tax=Thalassospira mesophila TaxID=1293891 RepID=UPI000A1FFB91|nr:GNAT family N-acetyltransferase [Thalassospira mesophila]
MPNTPPSSPCAPNIAGKAAVALRDATPADIAAISEIYTHAVLHGTASFEEIPPGAEELGKRQKALLAGGFPYLVAIDAQTGIVCGYAYAGPYRVRTAYRHTVENSIYVAPTHHGKGVGNALLAALITRCEAGPWRQMVAAIGDSNNAGSIALHRKHGFQTTGTFYKVGYKFGQWLDSVLMQRPLHSNADMLPGPLSTNPTLASTNGDIPARPARVEK